MRPWNKKNVTLKLEEMEKTPVALYAGNMQLDRTGKGKDYQDFEMRGTTFVNELGTAGRFDTAFHDSAVNCTATLDTDSLFGTYAQKITADGTATEAYVRFNGLLTGCGSNGDYLYISCFGKTSKSFEIRAHAGTEVTSKVSSNGEYVKNSVKIQIGDVSSDYIELAVTDSSTLSESDYGLFDGLQVINLSKLGYLPIETR